MNSKFCSSLCLGTNLLKVKCYNVTYIDIDIDLVMHSKSIVRSLSLLSSTVEFEHCTFVHLKMPSDSEGVCAPQKYKIFFVISIIFSVMAIAIMTVPFFFVCRKGYTGVECDICDSGYHRNKDGVCQGWKF